MKKFLTILTASALAAGSVLLAQPATAAETTITFTDSKLESCVRSALNLSDHAAFTTEKIDSLTNLNCDSLAISTVGGIENFTNLVHLTLSSNRIADISPIAALKKLETLEVQGNRITDVTAVGQLPALKWFYGWSNAIADISPIPVSIERLWIEGQTVNYADIAPGAVQANTVRNLRGDKISVVSTSAVIDNAANTWTFNTYGSYTLSWRAPLTSNPLAGYFAGTINQKVTGTPVQFVDDKLATCVNRSLGLNWNAEISPVQASWVTRLDCTDYGITDLGGIENLTNLTALALGQNQLTDITPVAGLTKITELQLQQNKISDISAVKDMAGLNWFYLWSNNVADVSALDGKPLERAWIEGQSLALPKLEVNAAQANPVVNVDGTAILPTSTTAVVDAASNSWSFNDIANNTLAWRAPITVGVGVGDYFSGSITQESEGSSVTIPDANLRACITDALGLEADAVISKSTARGLTNLVCDNAGVASIEGIDQFTGLKTLSLNGNSVTDIAPVAGLVKLTALNLAGNGISDITVLSRLLQLTSLELQDNNISDLSALSTVIHLEWLYAWNNHIADLSPLKDLPLDRLWIEGQTIQLSDIVVDANQDNILRGVDSESIVATSDTATVVPGTGNWSFAVAGDNTLTFRFAINPDSLFVNYFSGTISQKSVDVEVVDPVVPEPETPVVPEPETPVVPEPETPGTEAPVETVAPGESTDSTDVATSDESAE